MLSGSSTQEEESQVDQHFYDSFYEEGWDEKKLGDKKDVERRILSRVYEHVSKRHVSRSEHSSFLKYWKYAAVLALFVCIGIIGQQYVYNSSPSESTDPVHEVLQPGSDMASLELSDGTVLNLADLQVGEQYVNAGFLLEKTEEGNLKYLYARGGETSDKENKWSTLKTPLGGRYQISLADGTKVWLNAGSSLTFPESFPGNKRVVEASGEMYFEVSHNKTKPFIVQVQGMDIHVLGTSFNLSAYEDNVTTSSGASVALVEGSIQIKTSNQHSSVLYPGQKGTVNQKGIEITAFDKESEVAWKDDYFIFKDKNIKEIMASLGRWYNAEVEFLGEGWADKNFTIRMSRREGIDEILSLIELTKSVKFKIVGRRVIVST